MNTMQEIRIEKVTLNFGAGADQKLLEKGLKLLEKLTGRKPIKRISLKRIPTWGIRKNLPIGAKVTLRGQEAHDFLKRCFKTLEMKLHPKSFDQQGNFSFGIKEYIDMEGIEYEADLGILGFEVAVTVERPGFRVKKRRLYKRKLPKRSIINKDEVIAYVQKTFGVSFEVEEVEA